VKVHGDTHSGLHYASTMKSGLAVDDRVAISRGTSSPIASPVSGRRTAGPSFSARGLAEVHDDSRLLFCLPPRLQGAGGGGRRLRTRAAADLEPFEEFTSTGLN
jgi:hypothetical protein